MSNAANDPCFRLPEFDDPAFVDWAHRVTLRIRNLPPGSPVHVVRCTMLKQGRPSPAWAYAYGALLEMTR